MASLNVNASDGKTLTVQVPDGTDPAKYGDLADDALQHYSSTVRQPESGLSSAFRAFASAMPLGNQADALFSPGKYSDNLAAIKAQQAANDAEHPIADTASKIAGGIAPALIPGVGEAMAANPLSSGAALGAAGGLGDTDIKKEPLKAAINTGIGAASGATTSALLAKIMPKPDTLEAMANNRANASINAPQGILVDMTPEERQAQGAFLRGAGLVGKDKGKILDTARNMMSGYGETIGSIGDEMEKKGLSIDDPNQLTQPLIEKFAQFSQSANPEAKQLARTYLAGINDIESMAKPAIAEASSDAPALLGPTGKAIEKAAPSPEPITWSKIQQLKQTYGTMAFKSTGEVKNQAAADVYFTLSNGLKDIADQAANNPAIPNTYKAALAGYSRMTPIVSGLEKTVDADLRGASGTSVGFHPMRMLASMPGPVRAIGGLVAIATGHPILAAAAALPEAMNPAVQSNVLGAAAKAAPTVQAGLQSLAAKYAATPENQQRVKNLIQMLKQKYDQRSQF